MSYQIEIGGKADTQLAGLDTAIGAGVERKIQWLADNAADMVHRRLVGMPARRKAVWGGRTDCRAG